MLKARGDTYLMCVTAVPLPDVGSAETLPDRTQRWAPLRVYGNGGAVTLEFATSPRATRPSRQRVPYSGFHPS